MTIFEENSIVAENLVPMAAIAYQKEKVENAICFFAKEHQKKTRSPLFQTYLYKYLSFLDLDSVKDTGRPALGLTYQALPKGPVPIEIYRNKEKIESRCFRVKRYGENFVFISTGDPDLSFFSKYEIKCMMRLVEIYANKFVKSKEMSEASHQEIPAWGKTKQKDFIKYESQFDDDLKKKSAKDLNLAEEGFLIYQALEKAIK